VHFTFKETGKIIDFKKLECLYQTHRVVKSLVVDRKKTYESRTGVMTEEGDIETDKKTLTGSGAVFRRKVGMRLMKK